MKDRDKDKRYQSSLRNSQEYNILLHYFDDAVDKVWPGSIKPDMDIFKLEGTCINVSQKSEDLERLIVASYRLMKYIRFILSKKKLPYKEGLKFPNLYTALEHAVAYTTRGEGNLAIEADKLEAVSRAAFHWLKTMKKLGRTPIRADFEVVARKPTLTEWQDIQKHGKRSHYCYICKMNPPTDESDMLCDYCSGATERSMTAISKCSLCKMPCKSADFFCTLCTADGKVHERYTDLGKQTSIVIDREQATGIPHIDRRYSTGKLQDWGDIMLPDNRMNRVT
jgi:hypothetical protein